MKLTICNPSNWHSLAAKEMFQIHGVDAHGKRLLRKQLRRNEFNGLFRAS